MDNELKKTLWAAADKLRSSMDAAEYKHILLGLVFLKYVSDAFDEQREGLRAQLAEQTSDLYLDDPGERLLAEEERDYYAMANVFWVPEAARWESIRAQAKQPDIGVRIDDALEAIEIENQRLKGILDKRFGKAQLEPGRLGELVDLISKIGFGNNEKAKDVLGEVYEYFLGQFASAEGKKGGQFYTPASVVKVLVEVLAPHSGKVYDPCCGSGGMFVQSEKFLEAHGGRFGDISIYGQEANPTTWRLVAMNLAIRGLDFNLGKEPADTFHRDQHSDLRADYILANPPFNVSDWGGDKLTDDKRWVYGTPPTGNANYAWLQHILFHLSSRGQAGVVLANGSLSSGQNNEGNMRKAMIEADVVEAVVALPPQLFFNTQIPASLWFLAKDKAKNGRDRRGEVLFIDARKLGRMETRVSRVLDDSEIEQIACTVHAWRQDDHAKPGRTYVDVPGFSGGATIAQIAERGHSLTPARYVGAQEIEGDDVAFSEMMELLTAKLADQMARGAKLDALIREKLGGLGYDI